MRSSNVSCFQSGTCRTFPFSQSSTREKDGSTEKTFFFALFCFICRSLSLSLSRRFLAFNVFVSRYVFNAYEFVPARASCPCNILFFNYIPRFSSSLHLDAAHESICTRRENRRKFLCGYSSNFHARLLPHN